ncbi:MAG TPA: STAS domain-containing protein [Crocinitomicaceae bacterium]|nr:STAS domain-containing protein [Crocinitomicaceae bacterium]
MEFAIKEHSAETVICEISGRLLTNDEVNEIITALNEYLDANIVMDLKNLEYTSSSGLSLFIRLLTRTRIQNKKIVLTNIQENVLKLFKITKLNDIFSISNSMESALKSVK